MKNNNWAEYAACRHADLVSDINIFYESNDDDSPKYSYPFEEEAKLVCSICPVKFNCLDSAINSNEQWGIWGGLTYPERRKLVRQREKEHDESFFDRIIDDYINYEHSKI